MTDDYTPPTKKSFSLSAIALWGERLATAPAANWENFFSGEAVRDGRELYRNSKIAEIVLEPDGGAVVFRVPAPPAPFGNDATEADDGTALRCAEGDDARVTATAHAHADGTADASERAHGFGAHGNGFGAHGNAHGNGNGAAAHAQHHLIASGRLVSNGNAEKVPFLQIIFNFDDDGVPRWRNSSSAPRAEIAPFAVAALYVIEEFVAAEFPKIPLSAGTHEPSARRSSDDFSRREAGNFSKNAFASGNGAAHGANGNGDGGAHGIPSVVGASGNGAVHGSGAEREDRILCVRFASAENEISFTAFWKMPPAALVSTEKFEPALGETSTAAALTLHEREQLLRLVTAARKADFAFDAARCAYVLTGTVHAVRFVNEFFPLWQKRFEIDESARVLSAFSRSAREIDAHLQLSSESRHAFGLRWIFSLDGNAFSEAEIRAVLRHRGEAVFLPGRGIVRLRNATRAVANDWPDVAEHGLPIYTLLSLFRGNEAEKILVPDAKLRAWRKNFLKEPEPPADLPSFLRPYQARGVAWIHQMFRRGAHPLLADEMGLGKTVQTLALLDLEAGTSRNPALIVCPASVIPVWKNEIRRFFPKIPVRVLGVDGDFFRRKASSRERAVGETAGTRPPIWLASYGMLRANAEILPKKKFSCAVLDEAQFIKNPQAKATQACLKIVAERRLALTGTPIENRPVDLWSVFRFLMPGLLGRRATLETEIAEARDETLEKLKTQIAPFILRRTKQDVARELPKKVQSVLLCPLTPKQKEIYERLVSDGLKSLAAGPTPLRTDRILAQNATHLLTLLMRLRQAACDPALLPGNAALPVDFSGKISVLLDRLEEIVDNGKKVVVFSQFVTLLERVRAALAERFSGTPIFTLTGKTQDRDAPVKNFQTASGAAIFLVSLRAGGTGLTLSRAEYVFLLDPWWNPAVEEQAIDRVHRIGQTRRVFVYRMVAAGTIEERIEQLKQSKRAMFDTLVGALPDMSDWASHYPSLESLIALSE